MRLFDLITMCLQNLTRRKVRTLLTITGVVVGTCAIVVMLSIGVGMEQSQEAMLSQMGDLTMIDIYNYGTNEKGEEVILDDDAMETIIALPGVQAATPFYQDYNVNFNLFAGRNDRYKMYMYNTTGVYPEALAAMGFELKEGAFNKENAPYTIWFGEKSAYQFQDTRKRPGYNRISAYPDANGNIKDPFVDFNKEKLVLKTEAMKDNAKIYEYKVVYGGTMVEDWNKGYQTSQGAYMDIRDYKKICGDYYKANGLTASSSVGNYQEVRVKCYDMKYVESVEAVLQDMGYQTSSMDSIRKPMEEQAKQQQMVLGALGAISLFVAALGITNTMVMSIYERTREIGVMKVLGCFVGNIRTVFLMEAGSIGFLGGVIGVSLSFFISFLMNFFGFSMGGSGDYTAYTGDSVSVIPPWLVVMGMVFATTVGLVSGFYPANRAVQISALEAIKHD